MDYSTIIDKLIGAIVTLTLAYLAYKQTVMAKTVAAVKVTADKTHRLMNGPVGVILLDLAETKEERATVPGATQEQKRAAVAARLAYDEHQKAAEAAGAARESTSVAVAQSDLADAGKPEKK